MEIFTELRRLYDACGGEGQPVESQHVQEATLMVSHLFPPRRTLTAAKLLAALNLLNAAVKKSEYRHLVSYRYVKGMCSCLLYSLLEWPVNGVSMWVDEAGDITYFRVLGVQVSFHYVPMFTALRRKLSFSQLTPQRWDGLRLQGIAVELLRMVQPQPFMPAPKMVLRLPVQAMSFRRGKVLPLIQSKYQGVLVFSQPIRSACGEQQDESFPRLFQENKMESLAMALTFCMADENRFMLYRRKDRRLLRVMRYDGNNYEQLLAFLLHRNRRVWRRRKPTLEVGKFYWISPQQRICSVPPASQLLLLTRNNYLVRDGLYHNLCLSYRIACYLAQHYPSLRFVKTLNYNRLSVHHVFYNYRKLRSVPLGSIARTSKVWVLVDSEHELSGFDPDMLPRELVDDYLHTADFYREFRVVKVKGLCGLRGWHSHWLLPPLFSSIRVRNYHAKVQGYNGKWAVFSLCEECFVSQFIYEEIAYDRSHGCIYGVCDGRRRVIVRFNYNEF